MTPVSQGIEAVFPADEFDGRVARARALLAERDIDVLIVTGPENIFYLTGQQTPGYYTYQALLLPVPQAIRCSSCVNSKCTIWSPTASSTRSKSTPTTPIRWT